jgi:hypothetical protein
MALKDVSKMITVFQKQFRFAEWFTRVYREPMTKALTDVFAKDLPDGEEAPVVVGMVDSLVRGLRSSFQTLSGCETMLLTSLKKEEILRALEFKLTGLLRQAVDRARSICRACFGPEKADEAGFPSRMAEDPLPLLRQTDVVIFNLRNPEFVLGENLVPGSNHDAGTILGAFEPAAAELQKTLDESATQKAITQGKQAEKDEAMTTFRTTYSIFVAIVRGCFRLAGFIELADRMTLTLRRRPNGGEPDVPPTDGTPDDGTPDDGTPDSTPGNGTPDEAPEVPREFADLIRPDAPAGG